MDEKKEAKDKRVVVETLFWAGLSIVVLSFLYDQLFVITIPIGLACMILAGLESLLSKEEITKKISKFEEISKISLFLILNLMIVFSLKTRLPSWRKSIITILELPPVKTWWLNAILGLMAGLILLFMLTNFYILTLERKKRLPKQKEKVVKAILEEIRGWPRRPKKEIFKKIPLKGEIPEEVIKRYEKLIEARIHMKECIEKAIKRGYSLEKIREIARDLGWPEEEIQRLSKEVIKLGRKYIYFVFFLLGAALIIACILDGKRYPILIGIIIMVVALFSYPKIKIKRGKIKPVEEKVKPKKEKVKLEIPKISIGEKIRSIFRRIKVPKEKIKPKKVKPEIPKISIGEKIKRIFKRETEAERKRKEERKRKTKEERKKWKEEEKERKRKERLRLKEELKERREKKARERKKKITGFKEGISIGRLFRRRIKPPKEKIKPEKPKGKIKPKKEDLGIIRAIRESIAKAEKNETRIDTLFKLVKKYGRLRLSTIAIGFNIGRNQAEEWARILEEHKLSKTHYPAIGEPEIRKIEEPEKEESEEGPEKETKKTKQK